MSSDAKPGAKRRAAVLAEVRKPKYRQRVERDRTKYTRKTKHPKNPIL